MVLDDDCVGEAAVFDLIELEKFDGERWERFIHEPWMADRMWEIQVSHHAEGCSRTNHQGQTQLPDRGHPIMA